MELLILYVAIVASIVVGLVAYVARLDNTERMPTPPIPTPPDPIEVAFLRTGPGEVVRAVAISMAERGVLRIRSDGLERVASTSVSRAEPIENAIFDALTQRRSFPELSRAIAATVEAALEPVAARLRAAGLLRSHAHTREAKTLATLAVGAIVVIGIVVFARALQHRPTLPGVASGLAIALVAIVVASRVGHIGRTTERGRRYLALLTAGLPEASLRMGIGAPAATPATANPAIFAAPMVLALYGLAALRDTPYAGATIGLRSARGRGTGDSGGGGCGGCGWTTTSGGPAGSGSHGSGSHDGGHGHGCGGHGGCSSGCSGGCGGCGGCGG